ncbi:polysaccharide biosynthesis/export family protein [Pseudoalteromonas sp. SCSIO 43201]|uniref:polysaccharide biosynthesis/export family protein n=1 Tax=Pseudoalteromonas sp. SCSIO 43201 TaxID=2822842 RepID=UPI00207513F4|nr:polysaccharide biosynthesis/export family protein [Pseudoalteromonas sp. SCSIO 43201]USD29179.1 polysaccharide biosynthesis/export family protein [Pseudoalteromonas sp. SCSIO 43201]
MKHVHKATWIKILTVTLVSGILLGCANNAALVELEDDDMQFYGYPNATGKAVKHQAVSSVFATNIDCVDAQQFAAPTNFRVDKPLLLPDSKQMLHAITTSLSSESLPLSPGDLIELSMEYGEGFNGRYILDTTGSIFLPVAGAVKASGLTSHQLAQKLELTLTKAKIFKAYTIDVSVKVLNWAAIEVPVSGAVFQPGRVTINSALPEQVMEERIGASGDYSNQRLLSEAIRAAAGIRPDAKLDQVILIRQGWQIEADLSGILTGQPVKDYALIAGDQVIVPSTGCFQPHLVRPSQITPKGFRVFMSNLIDSAMSNSNAAIGRFSSNLPYGTRLLQAAISANCVGGKAYTNAPRRVALVSNNPITGQTQVIERSVEQLMRMPYRDLINPYVMPNDAIACYDSDVTNLRDIAGTLLDLIAPFSALN